MWLINTKTLKLESFIDEKRVPYAIMSHRWTEEEVSFQQFRSESPDVARAVLKMKGFSKIQQCCRMARDHHIKYLWVDTCCIDKSSSAELQEAINSMFTWYQTAQVCYAYLSDVDEDDFAQSQWFTRGWTLQELVAPQHMIFFNASWEEIGERAHLASQIRDICRVPSDILMAGWNPVDRPCIATIMSWASGRSTTRTEDQAYCLLGLFDVNMPLLYGEGKKAFQRLQEEIFRSTDDQTIFAWEGVVEETPHLFASSPDQFPSTYDYPSSTRLERRKPHMMTNEGIVLEGRMLSIRPRVYLASLNLPVNVINRTTGVVRPNKIYIVIKEIDGDNRYARIPGKSVLSTLDDLVLLDRHATTWSYQQKMITVVRKLKEHEHQAYNEDEKLAFKMYVYTYRRAVLRSLFGLQPFVDDTWVSYFGTKGDKVHQPNDPGITPFQTEVTKRRVYSKTLLIESGQYSSGPVAIMDTRKCAIRSGLLGFDTRFRPVCIISNTLFDKQIFTRTTLEMLFAGKELPHDQLKEIAPDPSMSLWTETLEVAALSGGMYKEVVQGVFSFTAEVTIGTEAKLHACILARPPPNPTITTNNYNNQNIPTYEDMRHFELIIDRQHPSDGWSVRLEQHIATDPSKEPRCVKCGAAHDNITHLSQSVADRTRASSSGEAELQPDILITRRDLARASSQNDTTTQMSAIQISPPSLAASEATIDVAN